MTIHSDILLSINQARFWSKVDRRESDACWLWQASDNGKYGQIVIRLNGRMYHLHAHRVAWELTHGPIPDGLFVCHTCDIPRCVNPAHLFLGTQADNMADMVAKGRARALPPPPTIGEKHPQAKLTWRDVREMRQLRAQGWTLQALADRFGVTLSNVGLIVTGKTWKDGQEG